MSAPYGPWDSVELAVAVGGAGGIGSLGTAVRTVEELEEQWRRVEESTDTPYIINHTMRPFNEESFAASLVSGAKAISFHMGVPADLIARTHAAGKLWIQQVIDTDEAEQALDAGADMLVAQGGEAGGHGGWISTLVIVPMVVDLAGSVPVIAAGGIADGRGLAAALMLGAGGVNVGTRFLASKEMAITDAWKELITRASPLDAVKVLNTDAILPPFSRDVTHAEPRSLRTPLVDALATDPGSVDVETTRNAVLAAILEGGGEEYLPFAGQSVGLVSNVLGAAEIVRSMVDEATTLLGRTQRYLT